MQSKYVLLVIIIKKSDNLTRVISALFAAWGGHGCPFPLGNLKKKLPLILIF